jgi:hypothetical protein
VSEDGGEIIEAAGKAGLFDALKAFFRKALRVGGTDAADDAATDVAKDAPKDLPEISITKSLRDDFKGEEVPGNTIWRGSAVKYLDESERDAYKLTVQDGKLYDSDGNLFDTSAGRSVHSQDPRAIFVMDEDGNIYASTEHSVGQFHHSSFLAGGDVAGAGELKVSNGELQLISDQSGHYWPTRDMTAQVVEQLRARGVSIDDSQIQLTARA